MGIKYKVNSDFFKNWSPEMAYVLGYIYADGSLEDASYLRGKYVRISSKDKEIIEKIRKVLHSEHRLQIRKPILAKHRNGIFLSAQQYLLRIGDHTLFDDLIKLGVTVRKSLSLVFPEIPEKYFFHFVRGYHDGDGSIFVTKENYLKIAFTCGNEIFLKNLSDMIHQNAKIKQRPVLKSNRSFQLKYHTNDALRILYCLYRDSNNLFLSRKFKIYQKFLDFRALCPSSQEAVCKTAYPGANPGNASN